MPRALLANNASTTLSAAITLVGATTCTVTSAATFPAPTGGQYFYATLLDAANVPEIVKVTNVTANTFTMVRAQDGTTARTFAIGAKVSINLTAVVIGELAETATTVQLTGDQTIAGVKTFSSPIVGSVTGSAGTATTATTATNLSGGSVSATTGEFTAGITVGSGPSGSSVTMVDTDEGNRLLHCNSNNIGFLTQAGGWGSYCSDDGSWTSVANITAYSDERLKKNWRDLSLDFVQKLAGVRAGVYERTDADMTQIGVSAQSLQEVMPEAVQEGADGMLSVAYGNAALAACVMLAREMQVLRAEIVELRK